MHMPSLFLYGRTSASRHARNVPQLQRKTTRVVLILCLQIGKSIFRIWSVLGVSMLVYAISSVNYQ